jgi:hypothetical protein
MTEITRRMAFSAASKFPTLRKISALVVESLGVPYDGKPQSLSHSTSALSYAPEASSILDSALSNARFSTLDTYTQALRPAKREAQSKVVRMILPEQTQTAVAGGGN